MDSFTTKSFTIKDELLILHPLKAIYWEKERTLILSDLHLGKSQHFRKHGLAVPASVSQTNFDRLHFLLKEYQPKEVLFLGDLFHSDLNIIWDLFCAFCRQYESTLFSLVPGNHDILPKEAYEKSPLNILPLEEIREPFIFTHHPLKNLPNGLYNLYGHIHPGIKLRGRGRQSLRLPCFYFNRNHGILPAFGTFTGIHVLLPTAKDHVFAIANNAVCKIDSAP